MGNLGFNGNWALDNNGNYNFGGSFYSQISYMVTSGAKWARIEFRLGSHYSDWTTKDGRGLSALDQFDNVVNLALSSGLNLLGVVDNNTWPGNQAQWEAHNAEVAGGNGDNTYVQNLSQKALVVLAQRYPSIKVWELWNEPDAWTTSYGVGGSFLYPSNFAWLLHHAYNDTRNAGLYGLTFVSGGLFGNDRSSSGVLYQSVQYIGNTYSMGIAHANWATDKAMHGSYPLDEIGLHLYINQGGVTTTTAIRSAVLAIHQASLAYEGTNSQKPIEITEVGWTTTSVHPTVQSANLTTALTELRAMPLVKRAYWFEIQDNPPGNLYYGLYDVKWNAKPALLAYKQGL